MDHILIKGLRIFAYHGVNPEEKQDGQIFELDVDACCDLSLPGRTDRVEDTVSYAKMIKTIRGVLLAEKNDLIEHVAARVLEALFLEYPPLEELEVTVKKPDAPMQAEFQWVGVMLHRRRDEI